MATIEQLRDRLYQRVFVHLFVYNILFEDAEVDERLLGIDERSSVLGITGAGCRIAGHLSQHPRRVDAVDINGAHLALTALKVEAARRLRSHSAFYDLFARGWHPDPEPVVRELSQRLPDWIARHWRRNWSVFSRSMLGRGLTARLLGQLRRIAGVDERWLQGLMRIPAEARPAEIDRRFEPVFTLPHVRALLESPLNLVAIGVNHEQRDRMLTVEKTDIVGFLLSHLRRISVTDLERNWFAWYAVAGRFNHDHPDAVPPYLRRDRHERSLGAPTDVRFHRRNIFDVLAEAGRGTWSHYTLCDAPDWMPAAAQRRLFDEIHRTSSDGAVVVYRSVEPDSIVERHGLLDRFRPMEPEIAFATQHDRTRIFRRIGYYRVVH
jgi:S-adenosylmethionine-diacylglycerol 3-amino-3-carboxypropyl transferase